MNSSVSTNNESNFLPNESIDETGLIVAAVIIISLFIFATVANSTTIAVIFFSPNLKSPFCHLICSLCISDLVSSIISLLELYRRTWGFAFWALPDDLCKILWGVKFCTMVVTSFHIVVFTVVRFLSVKTPTKFRKITKLHFRAVIGIIWITGFLLGFVPGFVLTEVNENSTSIQTRYLWPSCTVKEVSRYLTDIYKIIAYVFLIYIPILLVAVFSIGITKQIIKRRESRENLGLTQDSPGSGHASIVRMKKENHGILQLTLITGSFFIGYVPSSLYHIYSISADTDHNEMKFENQSTILGLDWWIAMVVYFCLRVSECLNPIFYNIASSKMRRETIIFFRQHCCRK